MVLHVRYRKNYLPKNKKQNDTFGHLAGITKQYK